MRGPHGLGKWLFIRWTLAWCLGMGLLAPAAAQAPASLFFQGRAIGEAKLSPSGRWLALTITMPDGRVGLTVTDTQDFKATRPVAHFNNVDVRRFHWVTDERIVFSVDQNERSAFDTSFAGGLVSIKRDGTEMRHLVASWWNFVGSASSALSANHGLLHIPPTGTDIIVGEYQRSDRPGGGLALVLPKRLNVVTGRATVLDVPIPPHTVGWLFDIHGAPRVATVRNDNKLTYLWRDPVANTWQAFATHDMLELPFEPVRVDEQQRLWVSAPVGPNREDALFLFDFKTGKPVAEPMLRTPGFDAQASWAVDNEGKALGLHINTDAYSAVWFDERLKALQAEAEKRLPDRSVRLSCRRCREADMTVLVHAWSDRDPGQFWIHHADKGSWDLVGQSMEGVDTRSMATLDFHRFAARDGREIPVWITLPRLPKGSPKPPAVVLVHGGPWVRGGYWHWDPMAQFLASRGYAVIEPEFRGSTGFGMAHFRAGWKQWGKAMQDDVSDALAWARKQGHVDGERACIMGASYGGYAALMGPIKDPGLYRCAVAWVAVSDPTLLFEWSVESDMTSTAVRYSLPRLIGDPQADADALKAVSPLHRAAELKVPLLLAYGSDDKRVPLKHGTRLREALQAAGNPPQWVVYAGEGHGGWTTKNNVDFAERVERFLKQHLR